ncbi:MAG: hypothetical protein GYA21_00480 [Myxococcales bacterium]|nr:hypothetical protein [Myxococcales bacterium]
MLKKRLGEILLEANAIDEYQLRSALGFQKKWGGRLGKVLVDNHFITEETLLSALQRQTGIAAVNLKTLQIPEYVLKLIPKELAEKNHLLPIRLEGDPGKAETLVVAMSDPTNLKALDEIQFKTGKKVKPVLAGEIALSRAIRMLYFGETDGLDLDTSSRDSGRDDDMVIVQGTLEQAAMAGEAAGFPAAAAPAPATTPPVPQSAPGPDDPFALLDALDGPAGAPALPAPEGVPPPAGDPAYATMEEIEDIFSNVEAPPEPAAVPPAEAAPAPPPVPETVLEAVDIELDEEISPLDEPPAPAQAAPSPAVIPVARKPAAVPAPGPVPAPAVQAPPAPVAPTARVPVPPAPPKPIAPVPPQPVQPASDKSGAAPKGIGDLLSRVGLTAPAEVPAVKPAAPADKTAAAAKPVSGTDPWLESLLAGAPEALEKAGGAPRVISALLRMLLKKRLLSEKDLLDALKPKS